MQPYHVIKGYLTEEQCHPLAKYFTDNEDYDPREFYGNIGLGGPVEFFSNPPKKFEYDPENILVDMVHFAYKFFLENYEMNGTFGLNRSHANFMHEGALLHSHHDDRDYRTENIDSLNSKTYVCGLFLSDDYEGGELVFEDEKISLKPSIGDLVFFPGFYTRHGVNLVTSGTRLNVLTHFFDVLDTSIEYSPKYSIDPKK
jgi:2OG-Fe(II) oxygenase superfamily